eukprot:477658_1
MGCTNATDTTVDENKCRPAKKQTDVSLKSDTKHVELVEFFRFSSMKEVSELLENGMLSDFTDWNIFALYDICGHHTLLICANYLFLKLNLYDTLNISQDEFLLFLQKIESGYLEIPYHSSLHGTDVMVNSFHFLINSNLIVSDLDRFIILLSAVCHDYKHPGFNSSFLMQSNHEIAIKYKNKTPLLEYMHANETLEVLSNKKYNGFLQQFTDSEIGYIKETVNDMILGTAPEWHGKHMQKLKDLNKSTELNDIIKTHKKDVMMIALHCADIGSVCKSYDLFCKWWIINIFREWFIQGDKEKELKLSKTWKMMDRDNIDKIPEWLYEFIQKLFIPLQQQWALLFSKEKQFTIWCENLVENNKKLQQLGFGDLVISKI